MAEIRLKMVEYAHLKFDHHFWSNFIYFGRNSTHGLRAEIGEIRPVWEHFNQLW
jgi:hypothetical protein